MTTTGVRFGEKNPDKLIQAIRDLQQGRMNAHGSFTLTGDGSTTSLEVEAPTCSADSHVNFTPVTEEASDVTGVYIVAANGSFTVNHDTTSDSDCDFTWSING